MSISHSLGNIFRHLYTYITFERGHEGNATWRSHLTSLLFQLNQEVITALLSHLIKLCRKALFSENDKGSNLKVGLSSCYWRGEGAWFIYVLFTQVPVGEILIQFVQKLFNFIVHNTCVFWYQTEINPYTKSNVSNMVANSSTVISCLNMYTSFAHQSDIVFIYIYVYISCSCGALDLR